MFSELTERQIERGREIMGSWKTSSEIITPDVKDQIGKLYIEHILQLGEEIATRFVSLCLTDQMDYEIWNKIGIAQAGIEMKTERTRNFWRGVNELAPQLLPDEDQNLFIEHATAWEVWVLISKLNQGENLGNHSVVINDLDVNAHAYK